jgi:hypothetical protein
MIQPYDGRNFEADNNKRYGHQADSHAARAERLLASIETGSYIITPVAVSVAQVHATLAVAYAQLEAAT